jgi:hypothetical protein
MEDAQGRALTRPKGEGGKNWNEGSQSKGVREPTRQVRTRQEIQGRIKEHQIRWYI